ncbi:MBL fold metallo-hydrolase [Marilutibacter aestuarii]|uniref:MBL fold metallo-hydrolase n=1 Tax=Marilutibacter aestuarii TaxID=1706195 RepID=A0A508A0J9_9GAMM|nr:MBL fold metallo-hydrolase [Lysobacter aestuarii]TQD43349.1 MBL fold metallo-hydrolase [Lysobacter aestuarii]
MQYQAIRPDVLVFVGDSHLSVATAFVDGDDVLLVDALGSMEDALAMRQVLCAEMGKTVRIIAATHYMSDHLAAMRLFPDAMTIAHRHHRLGFQMQNRPAHATYRAPKLVFDAAMTLHWGAHELRFVHNPGRTPDHVSVDVPTADLVCAGDNIVGHIVYVSRADPAMLRQAIAAMRRFGRGTVVGGHMGCFPAAVLEDAIHYLDRLQRRAIEVHARVPAAEIAAALARIRIEDCIATGVEPTDFEREWHGHNLEAMASQSLFALDAALQAREARA